MDKLRNSFLNFKEHLVEKPKVHPKHPLCQFETVNRWLDIQFHSNNHIVKPHELENGIDDPPDPIDDKILEKIQGSLIGLALGDALGAHVEFRPREYFIANPVKDLGEGGQWKLKKGQFTDNTSMALCLANSLIARRGFVPYDQLVRYKWWYQYGYMSSIEKCFNIGTSNKNSLDEFIHRQNKFANKHRMEIEQLDYLSDRQLLEEFPVDCSKPGVAGSGALMRLAPVPLFFFQHLEEAIELSGYSGQITHNDRKAYDACRYYGALIFAALNNYTKEELLDKNFYEKHKSWFGYTPLCDEIKRIAEGSYQKKGGYDDGIRGKGYIVDALEAALWAFWSDENSFEKGALAAVNLGDDTDTTAAIYGQLAGAYYGYKNLPKKWIEKLYAKKYIMQLSKWIAYEGKNWKETEIIISSDKSLVGNMTSNSVENLSSGESFLANPPARWRRCYRSIPARSKPKYNDIGFSALYSSWTNSENRLHQHNNINGLNIFENPISNEQQSTCTVSTPDSQHRNILCSDIALPSSEWYSSQSSAVSSSSVDLSTRGFKQSCEGTTIVPNMLRSISNMSDGMKSESSQVFTPTYQVPDLDRCMDWSCEDVCNWIRSLGTIYETYVYSFQRQNIDGHRLLNFVDEEALVEFGVTSGINRRVIIYSIKQLKDKYATSMISDSTHGTHFYDEFVGDFVPYLHLTDSTYPNTMSCILKPSQDNTHSTLYNQIVKWLGPLSSDVEIDKIELVHNAESYRMFLQQINRTERKQTQNAFQPHLDLETNPAERRKVLDRLQTLTQQVKHNRAASVVRLWHGCKRSIVSQLVSDGFAALGKLDNGWFGKAMYFTSSAEYAARYTNPTGCLIMCYVILLNPFPVITDDAPPGVSSKNFRFYGTGNYSNYQCHYIPVAPVNAGTSWNFRPPVTGVQDACFDEFAIFQQADILPQAIIHLKPGTSTTSSSLSDTFNENSSTVFLSKE